MADHTLPGRRRAIPIHTAHPAVDLAILRSVAYADVFDYPRQSAEVHRFLVGVAASSAVVNARLASLTHAGRLHRSGGYYTLPGRASIVAVRQRRAGVAARLWPDGIRYGRLMAQLPFVRMVAITGSLALDNVEPAGDIDYLVVTSSGRVWVGRAMANLLRRRAGRSGVVLCPNYVLSEQSLVIRERNLYTAHELVQMVPVAGHAVYRRMLELNRWTARFLPNAAGEPSRAVHEECPRGPLARLAEAALGTALGGCLERMERARLVRKMVPRAESLAEVAYSGERCKDHVHPHGQRILAAFQRRFAEAAGGAG